jgi:teichuronic acid biosynthesis glycosyltransferase TuaG
MEKVSIVMPVYNSEKYIEESINSIINQTYENWELIIINDASKDGSGKKIAEYAKQDIRIKYKHNSQNCGPAKSRNIAIECSVGRYIAFCDSDDIWTPEKLEEQVGYMKINNLSFTFSSYQKIDEVGGYGGIVKAPKVLTYDGLLKTCSVGCLTAIYDKEKIGKIYMPEIKKRQDYGLWIKIMKIIKETKGQEKVLAYYRVRKNSLSSNKIDAARYHYKVLKDVAELNAIKLIYNFICYIYYGFIKYMK